jgi:hypothetical protein
MKSFRDVIRHTHELVVREGWMHALRYEVINGPHSVAQIEWKCYRGILGKGSWGEQFSSGKLRHDVGE